MFHLKEPKLSTKQAQRNALLASITQVVAEGRLIKEAEAKAGKKGLNFGERALGNTVGRVTAAPFRAVGDGFASMILGPKQTRGVNKGKRLQEISGGPGKGLKEISAKDYADIKTRRKKGKAYAGVIGNKPVHYKQRYGRGGLVGLARKHPGKALGAAGIAYLLGTSKAARDVASALSPEESMPKNRIEPEVLRAMQQRTSGQNPLANSTWG